MILMQSSPLRAVEIEMYEDDFPDFSRDFFAVPHWAEIPGLGDVALVDDIDYCIDQARDWETCCGDYHDDETPGERSVYVEELPVNERMLEDAIYRGITSKRKDG